MRVTIVGFVMVAASVTAGCSDPMKTGGAPAAPHGGIMATVPGDKGYAEVLVAAATGPGGARKGQQVKSQVSVYFYQSDGTTEMSPAPTSVSVKVGSGAGGPTLALTPQPKDKGKFASEPAELPEGFRGQLEATVDGQPVQVPFTIR